jgi:type II secretory pathway predicted ATPase ExeA
LGEAHKLVSPARVFARPTADEIWLGPAQQAALSQLSRPAAIRLIVGPPSSGKTTLLNHFGAHLAKDSVVLACRGPKDDAATVLAALLLSADLAPWDLSEVEQRNLLTVFIQQRRSQNRRVLLLIDDAHNFAPAAVEEIERILVFKIEKRSALEAVVAGPASITSQWSDVRRRLGLELSIHELPAPSQEALVGYLDWRLSRFEMQRFMTPVALQMIARLCGGRYAAANVLCQMSLLLLRQLSLDRADARVVRQAVATLAARQAAKLQPNRPNESEQQLDAPPQGYLLVSRGGKTMTRIPLAQRTLVGRSEHNDVCLPSPYLSRHHAAIVGTPQGYYLVDLNSINGVLLNGRRIERTVLCDEDVLTMGPFRLKVQVPDGLARDTPFPEAETAADTAVMPSQAHGNSALWRVK